VFVEFVPLAIAAITFAAFAYVSFAAFVAFVVKRCNKRTRRISFVLSDMNKHVCARGDNNQEKMAELRAEYIHEKWRIRDF
jgi:aromatic ring-opening dioxygenase LigB subunit